MASGRELKDKDALKAWDAFGYRPAPGPADVTGGAVIGAHVTASASQPTGASQAHAAISRYAAGVFTSSESSRLGSGSTSQPAPRAAGPCHPGADGVQYVTPMHPGNLAQVPASDRRAAAPPTLLAPTAVLAADAPALRRQLFDASAAAAATRARSGAPPSTACDPQWPVESGVGTLDGEVGWQGTDARAGWNDLGDSGSSAAGAPEYAAYDEGGSHDVALLMQSNRGPGLGAVASGRGVHEPHGELPPPPPTAPRAPTPSCGTLARAAEGVGRPAGSRRAARSATVAALTFVRSQAATLGLPDLRIPRASPARAGTGFGWMSGSHAPPPPPPALHVGLPAAGAEPTGPPGLGVIGGTRLPPEVLARAIAAARATVPAAAGGTGVGGLDASAGKGGGRAEDSGGGGGVGRGTKRARDSATDDLFFG